MPLLCLLLVLEGLPGAYEVDFGALPTPNSAPMYKFSLVFSFDGLPNYKTNTTIGVDTGPAEMAAWHSKWAEDDPPWHLKRDGNRVTFYAFDKTRITSIVAVGDGPKPVVKRVLALPAPKK